LKDKAFPFNGNHLVEIPHFLNKSDKPFAMFAPFYNALKKEIFLPKGSAGRFVKTLPVASENLEALKLLSGKEKKLKFNNFWNPGRAGALSRLKKFRSANYVKNREKPSIQGTSFLSPHLHFGEVSIAEVWRKIKNPSFRRQLAWREFGAAFVYHYPKTPNQNWNAKFNRFSWENSASKFTKWKEGKTGYPIVDASMRQLMKLGWMHNRMRMVVASFLVKDLMLYWKKGAAWFWEMLLDADLGNNTLGWQWVAGCGPDPAPFFRIFNPVLQGKKFDAQGKFIKEYCPELKGLPARWVHEPWEAPEEILEKAKVKLGKNYPKPIVIHDVARKRALKKYQSL
jgi:deoxyribodipyrimidine photo-lyase